MVKRSESACDAADEWVFITNMFRPALRGILVFFLMFCVVQVNLGVSRGQVTMEAGTGYPPCQENEAYSVIYDLTC